MYSSQLTKKSGSYHLTSYGSFDGIQCPDDYVDFCSDEPFKGQTQAAFCSGFLVRNDANSSRIVTAGHCLSGFDCGAMAFIFDFKMSSASSINTNFPSDNVYFCKSYYFELSESSNMDFGVVELDRKVTGRTALPMRTSGTVYSGLPLVMVGHPSGIPMKYDDGAEVKDATLVVQFSANTDSYAGNSGSMIVNAISWEAEGILVQGNRDFELNGNCCTSNKCSDSVGCPSFETISRISQAYDWVYEQDLPYDDASLVKPFMLLVLLVLFAL